MQVQSELPRQGIFVCTEPIANAPLLEQDGIEVGVTAAEDALTDFHVAVSKGTERVWRTWFRQ